MSSDTQLSSSSSDSLFERARRGDRDAWEQLVAECYPKVRRVVARKLDRKLRCLYDSMDLTNDVFKSLVAKSDRFVFETIDALKAHLIQAAEQKVIDTYRRQHRQKRDVDREVTLSDLDRPDHRFEVVGRDPTPSQFAQASETREQILAGHSGADREVLELKSRDYTNEEAAERTGLHLRKVQRLVKKVSDSFRVRHGET